jgi:hypothetical protein
MKRLKLLGSIMILFSLLTLEAFAASNIDTSNKYAWSSNSGWVNFNDANGGVTVYSDHLEGYAWAGNIGWIRLGTYTGGGTYTYANTSQTDYGVNHDGAGNLSGYAWSSHVGWINFNPTHSQVTIDLGTGDFDGYAYAANVGWIHFQNTSPAYQVAYDATPAAPTDLIASTASENQIDLSWTDNSYNEIGFKIEQNGTLITTTDANATSYSNTSLSCDAEYSYTVIATNGNLDSSPATVTKTLNCPTPSYKLSIEKPIGGTITGDGINCGSDCSQYFDRGTSVSLTATPRTNFVLVAWEGDCDETGTVLINEDKTCTAQFLQPTMNVSATTLNFTEGENASSYSLWLNTPPNAPVTLTLTVDDDDLVLSETLLTFDETNWNAPQTIEITHLDDDIMQGLHEHLISHTVTSDDPNYDGLIIEDATVIITDNDAPGIHLSNYELTVTEGQTDSSYSITLTTQPLNEVTIQLSTTDSDNEQDRTLLSPQTLVFTIDNWDIPQNVIVSVVDDNLGEGNHDHTPIEHQVISDDATYDGFLISDVNVHVLDNDEPNLTLSSYQLNVTEGGSSTALLSFTLTTIPTETVTVTLTVGNQITVIPQSIVFDSQTWNLPQTVNVSAIDDDVVEGNHSNLILVTTTSADVNYHELSLDKNPTVNITDNDSAGINLSSHQVTVIEEGESDSYTIVLTTEPTHEVSIALTVGAHTAVSPNQLGFTLENWNIPQSITVSALKNDLVEGEDTQVNSITHQVSSDDPNYDGLAITPVTVTVIDSVGPDSVSLPGITLICQDCTISNAALDTAEAQPVAQGNYDFPQGLVSFELTELENPSTLLDIYYHNINQLDNFVYRKYGPTTPGDPNSADWYTFSNVTFALDTLEDQTMVKATLTLTDGALGDSTGVDGRIIDPGGIALEVVEEEPTSEEVEEESTNEEVEEESTSEVVEEEPTSEVVENEPTLEEENTTSAVSEEEALSDDSTVTQEEIPPTSTQQNTIAHCTVLEGQVNRTCNVDQQIFPTNIHVGETASISHALFKADVENSGLISNSTIGENATLTGGKLTGNITNEGTITDIEFVGAKLSGGTLSGTITNNSEIGGVIENVELTSGTTLSGGIVSGTIQCASDSTLQNVQLAAGTTVSGGLLAGEITGDSDEPPLITAAEIAPGAVLSNVRLSPSVELPDDVVLGPGVILPSEPPTIEDFGLEEADLASLDAEALSEVEPAVFAVIIQAQLAMIPPEAFAKLGPEQMGAIQKVTLGALTVKQFNSVSIKTLSGLTAANMGGFSTEVLNEFTPSHVSALQSEAFQQMPSEDVSKLFIHFDAKKIARTDILPLIPNGWQIDANTGAITAPEGAKLTPRTFSSASNNVLPSVQLPSMADIEQGIGLGGQGMSIKDNMKRSLDEQDLTDFVLSQNEETGILWVEGTGESEGIKFTFIPDVDNVIQVDGDKVPIGLSIEEGGFYTITTPDQKQYQVVPAPQDPVALSEALEGGEVVIGKRGDVMMELPTFDTRKRGKPRQVAMFDPLIQPAPDDLCVEIIPGDIVCDFENAPPSQQPGLHLEANTRAAYKNQQQGRVVFPDGTAQLITPTLLTPDLFAELGFEFEGVEDIVFNANGIFYVLYEGQPYFIVPKFEVVTEEVTEEEIVAKTDKQPGESSIVVNNDGTLTYTVVIDEESSNTRKRGKPRQVMQFEPEIQVVPDDLCVEIAPGEIVCDFE